MLWLAPGVVADWDDSVLWDVDAPALGEAEVAVSLAAGVAAAVDEAAL